MAIELVLNIPALRDGLPDETRDRLDRGASAVLEGGLQYEFLTQQDDKVRPSHAALHGSVWNVGDPNAPAPPLDYGCFAEGTIVEGVFDGASRAFYAGQIVEILTHGGRRLRVTPNHPIPTEQGVIAAGAIEPGRKLLAYAPEVVAVPLEAVDEQQEPATVEQAFAALAELGPVARTRNAVHYFHGDGQSIDGEIDVVGSYALLRNVWDAEFGQDRSDDGLAGRHPPLALPHPGLAPHGGARRLLAGEGDPRGGVGGGDLPAAGGEVHAGPLHRFGVALAAQLDASGQQSPGDHAAVHSVAAGQRIDGLPLLVRRDERGDIDWRQAQCLRFGEGAQPDACLFQALPDGLRLNPGFFAEFLRRGAGQVSLDEVRDVRLVDYRGHVFDLRSPYGYVVSDGVATSNCRCVVRYLAKPGSPAAAALPQADEAPAPPAVHYAAWLDENVDGWKGAAAAAKGKPPAEWPSLVTAALQRQHPEATLSDVRAWAALIIKAALAAIG